MNRLSREDSFEGRLDRTWLKLTPTGKSEFENKYGRWDSLTDEQRFSGLSSYFSDLRQQAEEERIRRIQEPYLKALEGLGVMLDRRFGQIEGRLEQMNQTGESVRGQVLELEDQLRRPRQLPEPPAQNTTAAPNVHFNTALLMNCTYRKDGPKDVVSERQEDDGVYRSCSVGQQIRARRMLPHLLTSVYKQTGCPSNPLGPFRCQYITYDKVKVN